MNKSYEPRDFEQNIYNNWVDKGYFKAKVNSRKKPFTIVMPPPNITGQLHIGHALDDSLQDCIIRYKRMKGFEALYLPGTDHASIATEVKIVEALKAEGTDKKQLGREGFLKRAYDWRDKYGNRIVEQQKRLGLSCDWDRAAFTMDDRCTSAVREAFKRLYEKGLIYRGDRIISWCPTCKTALSDAEVEHEDSDSSLWYIKYPLSDDDGFVIIATTRPETMLGDTAVAVNPSDSRYKKFIGKNIALPLTNRVIPIIADAYVEKAFGTGAVKITPAHDPNDFEVGRRHNLASIRIMNEDGSMSENTGKYKGLDRKEARQAILADLEGMGLLVKTEKHLNSVGHCYRCHDVVEPMVSKQWFLKMSELVKPAIAAVKKTKDISFIPKRFEKMYLHWMENTRDWCISRQLWWGHRIPVFYCDKCGKSFFSETQAVSCPDCGAIVRQDEDVLDTWFSSALWPFSTLGWPQKTPDLDYFYPTDVLVTAYDIIGFWVSRMIFSGLEYTGKKPFGEVLIHGLVRDDKGRKMSKSLGNGIDPLELIDKYGTDALRFSLICGIRAGGDIKYSTDKAEYYSTFMNKIWNAARFVLQWCDNANIKNINEVKLSFADKWILGKLYRTINKVTRFMENYEIGLAAGEIYTFLWNNYCDWYIEFTKPILYSDKKEQRDSTLSVLLYVLRETLKLAHPIIPFITAEIYNSLPNKDAEDIMISQYPTIQRGAFLKPFYREMSEMTKIMQVIRSIRNLRAEMNVEQNKRTAIYFNPNEKYEGLLKKNAPLIQKLAGGSESFLVKTRPEGKNAVLTTEVAEIYIPMGELIDFDKERQRLNKELEHVEAELALAQNKLANQGFVKKAPPALIDAEKEKIVKYTEQRERIIRNIENLN